MCSGYSEDGLASIIFIWIKLFKDFYIYVVQVSTKKQNIFFVKLFKTWWCNFCSGGYFGAGWIRDLWRIPTYVKDANDDPEYLENLAKLMKEKKRPPISVSIITVKSFCYFCQVKTIKTSWICLVC